MPIIKTNEEKIVTPDDSDEQLLPLYRRDNRTQFILMTAASDPNPSVMLASEDDVDNKQTENPPPSFGFFVRKGANAEIIPVYRGDRATPSKIFECSFNASGTNTDIVVHVCKNGGGFVSTSTSMDVAVKYAIGKSGVVCDRFVYEICPSKHAIDPYPALLQEFGSGRLRIDDFNNYTADLELLEHLSIKKERIKGAWRIKEIKLVDGEHVVIFDKKYIPNPHYIPPFAKVSKVLKFAGGAATAVGAVMDGTSLHAAYEESQEIGNYEPLLDEGARVMGGWVGAYTLGTAFARAGALAGFRIGPTLPLKPLFSMIGGFVLGGAGSIFGYFSGEKTAQWLRKNGHSISGDSVAPPEFIMNFSNQVIHHHLFENDDIRSGYLTFIGAVPAPSIQERMAFDPNYLTELQMSRWSRIEYTFDYLSKNAYSELEVASPTANLIENDTPYLFEELVTLQENSNGYLASAASIKRSELKKNWGDLELGLSRLGDGTPGVGLFWTNTPFNQDVNFILLLDKDTAKGIWSRVRRLTFGIDSKLFTVELPGGKQFQYEYTLHYSKAKITFYPEGKVIGKYKRKSNSGKWETVEIFANGYTRECEFEFLTHELEGIEYRKELIDSVVIRELNAWSETFKTQGLSKFESEYNAALEAQDYSLARQLAQTSYMQYKCYLDEQFLPDILSSIDAREKHTRHISHQAALMGLVELMSCNPDMALANVMIGEINGYYTEKSPITLLHIAEILEEAGDLKTAVIFYEKALDLNLTDYVNALLIEHDLSTREVSEKRFRAMRLYSDDAIKLLMQEISRTQETEKQLLAYTQQIKVHYDGRHHLVFPPLIDGCERELAKLKITRWANELEAQLCDLKRENFRLQSGILLIDFISFFVRKYEESSLLTKEQAFKHKVMVFSEQHALVDRLIISLRSPIFQSLQSFKSDVVVSLVRQSVIGSLTEKVPRCESDDSSLKMFKAFLDMTAGLFRTMSDNCQREMKARVLGVGNDPSHFNSDERASLKQFFDGFISLIAHSPLGSILNDNAPESLIAIYQVALPIFKTFLSLSPEELLQLPMVKDGLKLSESKDLSQKVRYAITDFLFHLAYSRQDKVTQSIGWFNHFNKYAVTLSAGVEILTGLNYFNAANQLASISIRGPSTLVMIPLKIFSWTVDTYYRFPGESAETLLPLMIEVTCKQAPETITAILSTQAIAAVATYLLPDTIVAGIAATGIDIAATAGVGTLIWAGYNGYKLYNQCWYQNRLDNAVADLKSGQIEAFLMAGRRVDELRTSYPDDVPSQKLMQVITDSAAILNHKLEASAKTTLEQYLAFHEFAYRVLKAPDDIKQQYSMYGLQKIQQQLQSTYTMYGQQREWWLSQLQHFADSAKVMQQFPEHLVKTVCQFKKIHQDLNNAIEFILKYHKPSSEEREAFEVLKASYEAAEVALKERHTELTASDLTAELSKMGELLETDEFKRLTPLIDERHRESLRYSRRQVTSQLTTHLVIMGLEYVFETLRINRLQTNRRLPYWFLPAKITQSDFPILRKSQPDVMFSRKQKSPDPLLRFQKQPEKTSPLHCVRPLRSSETSALFFKSSKTQPDLLNRGVCYAAKK